MSTGTDLGVSYVNAYLAGKAAGTSRGGLFTITAALAAWYKTVLPATNLTPALYDAYSAAPAALNGYPSLLFLPDPAGSRQSWGNNSTRTHETTFQGLLICAPPTDDAERVARRYEDWPVALDVALTPDPSLGGVCNNIRGVHGTWGLESYGGLAWIGYHWQLVADTYYGPLPGNIAYVGR